MASPALARTLRLALLVAFGWRAMPGGAALVEHVFNVTYAALSPDGRGPAMVQAINGMLPGPPVVVRRFDRLRVTVVNQLAVESLTVHWHGFEMRAAQEFDGAMMITQCGIKPGTSFTYDFVVDEHPGTYLYHEHAALEHVAARGMFGSLVVEPEEGQAPLYSYSHDQVVLLSDWWQASQEALERKKQAKLVRTGGISALGNAVGLLPFDNLLINGRGAFNIFKARPTLQGGFVTETTSVDDLFQLTPRAGETWRLRVANVGAMFAVTFRIDNHRLRVIQADGFDVQPYDCDVLEMSSGERFDILVTFDQNPDSYWMRAETLEDQPGIHHGQLGVVRYDGAPAGVRPGAGFPMLHRIREAPWLVVLNCVDLALISATCRPITDLRRLQRSNASRANHTHDFEVAFRGFAGEANAHFTRVLDLGLAAAGSTTFGEAGNQLGPNQYDGEYVQLAMPHLPYSYVGGNEGAQHPNTLVMRVAQGETVRVVLQLSDRSAHPWHLHGHKFAVLATGFPDYAKDCDFLFCRSEHNWWLTRDGVPPGGLLDPAEAPLKDTVHVPAGGWVVLQFVADNPGWWFFHCHMLIHVHDGMGLILLEGVDSVPARLTNRTYLQQALPSCDAELEAFRMPKQDVSCPCWQNPEMRLDNLPRSTYKCSQPYLCGDETIWVETEGATPFQVGKRDRASGMLWRLALSAIWVLLVMLLFMLKEALRRQQTTRAHELMMILARREARTAGDTLKQALATAQQPPATAQSPHSTGSPRRPSIEMPSRDLPEMHAEGQALQFKCMCESAAGITQVHGYLPPGSICAVLGANPATEPWLQFMAGRRAGSIWGKLALGGRLLEHWDGEALRQAKTYLSDFEVLRKSLTVAEALELPLRLISAPDLYRSRAERMNHIAMIIHMFKLGPHLTKRVVQLNEEQRLHVLIAQELVLPRALIVMKGPLEKLKPKEAARLIQVCSSIAEKLQVTIVFSTAGWIPGDGAPFISHVMLMTDDIAPKMLAEAEIPEYLAQRGQPVPRGWARGSVAWASEVVIKGLELGSSAAHPRQSGAPRASLARLPAKMMCWTPLCGLWSRLCGGREAGTYGVRRRRCFWSQLRTLLVFQLASDLEDSVTIYRAVETLGIGVLAGLVWFQKGAVDTQTALAEVVGLLFFSCALYTVPPVFQALAAAPDLVKRVLTEHSMGWYHIHTAILASTITSLITLVVWAPVWLTVTYSIASLGASPWHMLAMCAVLSLNVMTMRTMGLVLYIFVPLSVLNTVMGNLAVQMFMLTNGFYSTLPTWLQWVTVISIPRYTFRALLKLEYSWRDTFEVHPMHGNLAFGYPSKYISAEATATFGLMRERHMGVMQSPLESSCAQEMLVLICLSVGFTLIFILALSRQASEMSWHTDPRAKSMTMQMRVPLPPRLDSTYGAGEAEDAADDWLGNVDMGTLLRASGCSKVMENTEKLVEPMAVPATASKETQTEMCLRIV